MKLLLTIALFAPLFCFPQAGSLDLIFGNDGKVEPPAIVFYSLALQNDGKIVAGGTGNINGAIGFCVERFLQNGELDTSFANKGINIINNVAEIYCLIVTREENIIAAGDHNLTLVKYTKNGNLDSSFGINGISTPDVGAPVTVFDIALQKDGKIVVTGIYNNLTIITARFMADGSLDKSFNNGGFALLNYGRQANALVIQPDGKIIVGGKSFAESEFITARYMSNGTLDYTYGTNGIVRTHFSEDGQYINDLALQLDGKLLAAGVIDPDYGGSIKVKMALVRYNTDGSVDESFGNSGLISVPFYNDDAEAKSLLLQPDGKIVLAGTYTDYSSFSDFALTRVTPDGIVDSSFGQNGLVTTDFGAYEACNAAAFQDDGKIITAGYEYTVGSHALLARYNNDKIQGSPLFVKIKKWLHRHGITWNGLPFDRTGYYIVERSADGIHFNEIATIANTTNHANLNYEDNAPLSGINYYRLRAESIDGSVTYSNIIGIDDNTTSVHLYPNPVKDVLNIKGLDAGMSYELSVMSAKGNIVAKTSINNSSSYKWNLRSLSRGVYYLQAESGKLKAESKKTTVKFVKE